jgi:hypothetical protein
MFRQPRRYSMKIRDQYELSRLTTSFLGSRETYFLHPLAAMYGIMWVFFCGTFANSFADKFPLGDMEDGYKFYIAMFMVVTIMSCTSVSRPTDPHGMQ